MPLDGDLKPPRKRKVGFALMTPEQRRAVSRKGGMSSAKGDRPFAKDRLLAIRAGKKGGSRRPPEGHNVGRPPGTYTQIELDNKRRREQYKALYKDPMHPANRKV